TAARAPGAVWILCSAGGRRTAVQVRPTAPPSPDAGRGGAVEQRGGPSAQLRGSPAGHAPRL
ncbi:MAG: hypothetical protein AVDCRST_MAG01-01-1766, partial [uncultured Rubrobacteraceae bacterium]